MRLKTVIFDIDGTLADVSHRRHHVARKPKNWGAFFAAQHLDLPIEDVVSFCRFLLYDTSVNVIFCSGRGEEHREVTETWLKTYVLRERAPFRLMMRPAKDSRPDDVIKQEMLDVLKKEGQDIWFVVDDRQRVVDMWRANGLTVFQCAPGDFDTATTWEYTPEEGECMLTLMIGPSGAGKSTFLKGAVDVGLIQQEHILSSDATREALTGDPLNQTENDRVFSYIHETVKVRSRHGFHTVIDATHLRRTDRLMAVSLVPKFTMVQYIVMDRPLPQKLRDGGWRLGVFPRKDGRNLIEVHHQSFQSAVKDIMRGDDLPNVSVADHRVLR